MATTTQSSVSCFVRYNARYAALWNLAENGTEFMQHILRVGEASARIATNALAIQGKTTKAGEQITYAFDAAGSAISACKLVFSIHEMGSGSAFQPIRVDEDNPNSPVDILKTILNIAIKILTAITRALLTVCYFAKMQLFELKEKERDGLFAAALSCASVGVGICLVKNTIDFIDADKFESKVKTGCDLASTVLTAATLPWDFGLFFDKSPELSLVGSVLMFASSVFTIGYNWLLFDPNEVAKSLQKAASLSEA